MGIFIIASVAGAVLCFGRLGSLAFGAPRWIKCPGAEACGLFAVGIVLMVAPFVAVIKAAAS